MRKSMYLRILAIAFLAVLATSSAAFAQATRTWVSGVGDDANPCSRTAPCKTFAGAISKTAVCGEIDVLDPGGFGALTITKCISIEAEGVIAGVLVSGTNAFVVAAGNGDNVMIRGLTFDGLGTSPNGIRITSAGKVYIENCHIHNFTGFGIDFEPGAGGTQLFVHNTEIRDSGNFGANSGGAMLVAPSPVAGVNAMLSNVRMNGNVVGLKVQDGGLVMAKDCHAAGNKFSGFTVNTAGATATNLFLDQCVAANNGTGLQAAGGAANASITNSSFFNNGTGIFVNGGVVATFSTNNINGNGTNVNGTLTKNPPAQQ
jgi:hypothetical protein